MMINRKNLLAILCAIAMLLTAMPVDIVQAAATPTQTSAAGDSRAEQPEQATYNAYTSFRIWNTFADRDVCVSPKQGIGTGLPYLVKDVGKTGNHVAYDYSKQYLVFNPDTEQNVIDGGFQDAKIDKNGTYTMEMNNLESQKLPYINAKKGDVAKDGRMFAEDTKWSSLAISTDIPTSIKGVACTNVKVYFDDETTPFATLAKAPHNTDEGDARYSGKNGYAYAFYIFDTYYENHGTEGVLDNTEEKYLRFPKKSMRIEFTISGVDFTTDTPSSNPGFSASLQGYPYVTQGYTYDKPPALLSYQAGDEIEITFTVEKKWDTHNTNFSAFTASIGSSGGFWGWDDPYGENVTSPDSANIHSVNVTAPDEYTPGEYTLRTTATESGDSDTGAVWIDTNLTELPEGYTISGKTVKVAGMTYNWSKAKLVNDEGIIRLSLWNQWNYRDGFNPLQYETETKIWAEDFGEYTLKDYVPFDASSDTGAVFLQTSLKQLPGNYTISGKTVKIGNQVYDWSKAEASLYKTRVCLFLWNAQSSDAHVNPIDKDITLHAGDEIEMTFTVTKKELPNDPEKDPDGGKDDDKEQNGDKDNSTDKNQNGGNSNNANKNPNGDKNNSGNPDKKPSTSKPAGLGKNKTFTSGHFKYKVTAAAKKQAPARVTVTGLSAAGEKKSSLVVKNTVSFRGYTYKVTAINSGVCKGASRLTKAQLGTGISSIPANAFKDCKKLSSVTAKAAKQIGKGAFQNCTALKKLVLKKKLSVKKGAFRGCKKVIKVSGGSRKINQTNVKRLKKSGYRKFK